MRKIVLLASLFACTTLFGTSCSNNDSNNSDKVEVERKILKINEVNGGTLALRENASDLNKGDFVTFEVTTEPDYYLSNIEVNTEAKLERINNRTFKFQLLEDENIFTPIFMRKTDSVNCAFTYTSNLGGEIKTESSTYKSGSYINLNVLPDDGYEVSKVLFNGKNIELSKTNTYKVLLEDNINLFNVEFKKVSTNPDVKPDPDPAPDPQPQPQPGPSEPEVVNDMEIVKTVVDVNINSMKDPYASINQNDFYNDYTPATSYEDSFYRSKHYLMSGDITPQREKPVKSDIIKKDGVYLKNALCRYEVDRNGNYISYTINTLDDTDYKIYYCGGYTSLEETAAYNFAFGKPPANTISAKKENYPSRTWGKYLRCNKSDFSGNTTQYPYQPILTDIFGNVKYYETDFGSIGGFDCGGRPVLNYNNGTKIERGTCRYVVGYKYKNGQEFNMNDRHVFYTYNHYNDFQEYLNYKGGWTERFGNITAGNKYNDKKPSKKPTPPYEYLIAKF